MIDVETTGLASGYDRVVEIALVRVEGGKVVDEWATLVDPGREPGPTFIHHITQDMVSGAPTFGDVVGEVLARLDGAVVVAHNASFEEGFLRDEFARLGIATAPMPALCTLRLARSVLAAPNYRLGTCCAVSGVDLSDAHSALGDTRALACLLPKLLAKAPDLRYSTGPSPLPRYHSAVRPRTRASGLRKGSDGWLRSLLTKLPYSMADADSEAANSYLTVLGDVLADGKLTGDEAKQLARLAGRAGMGAAQVRALNRRFLDGLRDAALADDVVTREEQRQLATAARLLDEPDYFADLVEVGQRSDQADSRRQGRRVWCSPAVPREMRDQIVESGYSLASNITRTVIAAVVADVDRENLKVKRATDIGVTVLGIEDAKALLVQSQPDQVQPETVVDPRRPAEQDAEHPSSLTAPGPLSPPAGWYPDPSGRNIYRYWNGSGWAEMVSPGDGTIWSDTVGLPHHLRTTYDGLVDGRAPHAYVAEINRMAPANPQAALVLVLRCIDASENQARSVGLEVSPWYYEYAASLFAFLGDKSGEGAVLERLAKQCRA